MKKVRFDYVVSIQNEISEQDRYDLVCSIIDVK